MAGTCNGGRLPISSTPPDESLQVCSGLAGTCAPDSLWLIWCAGVPPWCHPSMQPPQVAERHSAQIERDCGKDSMLKHASVGRDRQKGLRSKLERRRAPPRRRPPRPGRCLQGSGFSLQSTPQTSQASLAVATRPVAAALAAYTWPTLGEQRTFGSCRSPHAPRIYTEAMVGLHKCSIVLAGLARLPWQAHPCRPSAVHHHSPPACLPAGLLLQRALRGNRHSGPAASAQVVRTAAAAAARLRARVPARDARVRHAVRARLPCSGIRSSRLPPAIGAGVPSSNLCSAAGLPAARLPAADHRWAS